MLSRGLYFLYCGCNAAGRLRYHHRKKTADKIKPDKKKTKTKNDRPNPVRASLYKQRTQERPRRVVATNSCDQLWRQVAAAAPLALTHAKRRNTETRARLFRPRLWVTSHQRHSGGSFLLGRQLPWAPSDNVEEIWQRAALAQCCLEFL